MLQSSENSALRTENNSFWSVLREAVAGSSRDFTKGSIGLAIFILSVPMILEMFAESLFFLVDVFFVAKLGADAVASVGITEAMLAIIYAFGIGLSIGATATVARRIGEKDPDGAAKSATHAIYLGVITSIILGIVGFVFATQFLHLLGASEKTIEVGGNFTRLMLGGNFVIVFLFILNAIFRAAGDAAISMRVLWFANGLNIILGPCFIFGLWFFPELGVTGAATATLIGRGSGVLLAFLYLFKGEKRFEIHARHWQFDSVLLWSLVKLSASAVLQFTIGTASWLGLMRVISPFGSEAIAGYTISIRMVMFTLLPSIGLSNAAATLVGQNLGAEKPERAERSVWVAAFYNSAVQLFVGLLLAIFAAQIIGFFTQEPNVLRYGADSLRIIAYGYVFYGFGMVLETAFNGAGDTWTPTYLNFFVFWLFEIPLAYIMANYLGFGAHGVFWSITAAFSMLSIVSAIIFRRGKWKLKQV